MNAQIHKYVNVKTNLIRLFLLCRISLSITRESSGGAGETAQWSRALAALSKDLHLVPSTQMINSSSRGSNTLFWPLGTHGYTEHICRQNTHTYNINIIKEIFSK